MPKRREINKEQVAEIEKVRKENKDKNVEMRLKALLLHAGGIKHVKVAEQTGFAKSYISELVCKYCNNGIKAIVENKYAGNHRNLSIEEEKALLEPFKKAAESGQIVGINEIKQAYESAIGRSTETDHGRIYRVLARHGWRKIMPRSKHPNKASDEAIEASKKLTPR